MANETTMQVLDEAGLTTLVGEIDKKFATKAEIPDVAVKLSDDLKFVALET